MFHLQETWTLFGLLIDVGDMLAVIINMFFLVGWCGGKFVISQKTMHLRKLFLPRCCIFQNSWQDFPEHKGKGSQSLDSLAIQELMHWDGGMKRLKEPTKKWGLGGVGGRSWYLGEG